MHPQGSSDVSIISSGLLAWLFGRVASQKTEGERQKNAGEEVWRVHGRRLSAR